MGEHSGVTPAARRGITRREAINYCMVAAAGVAGGGAAAWMVRDAMRPNPGDVFPGDAPTGEQWRLWQQRGWVKEGYHYLKLGDNVQCKVCPNNCILAPGDRSHCRNKINKDGTLYTLAYGNPCAFHLDPVEKKPLFHFLPGSTTFSIATAGCVFRCLNCQNWEISQKTPSKQRTPPGRNSACARPCRPR
jgi:pyruvate formate lyase activating enzyme